MSEQKTPGQIMVEHLEGPNHENGVLSPGALWNVRKGAEKVAAASEIVGMEKALDILIERGAQISHKKSGTPAQKRAVSSAAFALWIEIRKLKGLDDVEQDEFEEDLRAYNQKWSQWE